MLGFAPLSANPLASAASVLIAVTGAMGATGTITISGSANATPRVYTAMTGTGTLTFSGAGLMGLKLPMTALGGPAFGGSGFLMTEVYTSALGPITFGGSPLLRVAGRPLVFTALPSSFQFRADGADFAFVSQTATFHFRGVPE